MNSFEIIWSNFAENELDEIFTYYSEVAGVSIAKNLLQNIIAEPKKLIANPKLGQCEELLLHRSNEYRYLLYKQFKLIYSVDYERKWIKIADVFDSRQNPKKLNRTN
jgi:plasmid stabilization system protein ParE